VVRFPCSRRRVRNPRATQLNATLEQRTSRESSANLEDVAEEWSRSCVHPTESTIPQVCRSVIL
jgi:hypothetical protein